MRSLLRKIRYYSHLVLTKNWEFVFRPFLRWLFHRYQLGSYKGIVIYNDSFNNTYDTDFFNRTLEALQLIERVDPKRFYRIQREIHFIVKSLLNTSATYGRVGRICRVDFSKYKFSKNAEWYLYRYASTLVHEATHGTIYSHYINYTRKTRVRIERLCYNEGQRFLKKINMPDVTWSEMLLKPFDEKRWHSFWNDSFFTRLKKTISRIREARH